MLADKNALQCQRLLLDYCMIMIDVTVVAFTTTLSLLLILLYNLKAGYKSLKSGLQALAMVVDDAASARRTIC